MCTRGLQGGLAGYSCHLNTLLDSSAAALDLILLLECHPALWGVHFGTLLCCVDSQTGNVNQSNKCLIADHIQTQCYDWVTNVTWGTPLQERLCCPQILLQQKEDTQRTRNGWMENEPQTTTGPMGAAGVAASEKSRAWWPEVRGALTREGLSSHLLEFGLWVERDDASSRWTTRCTHPVACPPHAPRQEGPSVPDFKYLFTIMALNSFPRLGPPG